MFSCKFCEIFKKIFFTECISMTTSVLVDSAALSWNISTLSMLTYSSSYNLHLFVEFWLVDTWLFAHWRHQRAVTRLKNVRQLNIRRGIKRVSNCHKVNLLVCYKINSSFLILKVSLTHWSVFSFETFIVSLLVNVTLFTYSFFRSIF